MANWRIPSRARTSHHMSHHGSVAPATAPTTLRSEPRRAVVLALGALVGAVAAALVIVSHDNHPAPFIPYHDTWEYVHSADRILAGGAWADPARMPGYPLLLAAAFAVTGRDNLVAADALQGGLFIVAALGVYALAYQVWRSTVLALLIGLVFASNVYIFSFVKPILSDGLALVLTIGLALALASYIRRPGAARLWMVAGLTLALVMTRAEWDLAPVPMFACLLLLPGRWGGVRRLWPHALAALALIYGVIGGYVLANARINGFAGLTDAENINLYGKVIQYHMQDEAPARYAGIMRTTDQFIHRGMTDPWIIYWHDAALGRQHFALIGAYARAVIEHHPIQFLLRSVPLAFHSLASRRLFAPIIATGPYHTLLAQARLTSLVVFPLYVLFPVAALLWWVMIWRQARGPARDRAAIVATLALVTLYDLAATTVGSYDEYARLHLGLDPLMLVIVIGSGFWLLRVAFARVRSLVRQGRAAAPTPEDTEALPVV